MHRIGVGVIVACLAIGACGSSSSTVAPTPSLAGSAVLESAVLAFADDFATFTHAGATAQVTVLGTLAGGTTRDITTSCANWQSDNPLVLVVSGSGLMTARGSSGAATVTTACQGVSARGLVTLNPPPPLAPFIPPPSSSSCSLPPYEITVDTNGRKHCRETQTGKFALDACCGI